jgi:hypothetical protein
MDTRAADILLGSGAKGDSFTIKWHGINLHLSIKPISTERLIRISRELSKISDFDRDEQGTMFHALMDHVKDAPHIARAIAIATGTRLAGIVTTSIMELPPADLSKLFDLVVKHSDPEVFFYTIISARKTNLFRKTQKDVQ